jgi:hypothetical protein
VWGAVSLAFVDGATAGGLIYDLDGGFNSTT